MISDNFPLCIIKIDLCVKVLLFMVFQMGKIAWLTFTDISQSSIF